MTLSKRDFLGLGAAASAGLVLPAWAQGKPLFDTLNMFVPAAPGGGWDGTARAIERAAKAAGLVGNMAFENVGGAGGMVGLPRFVNQRKGQANTLMVAGSVMIGAALANKSPVTVKDVTPIARLTEEKARLEAELKAKSDAEARIVAEAAAKAAADAALLASKMKIQDSVNKQYVGKSCPKLKSTKSVSGVKLVCVKRGTKLVWVAK